MENPLQKARRYLDSLKKVISDSEILYKRGRPTVELHSIVIFTEIDRDEARESGIDRFLNQNPARALYRDDLKSLSYDTIFDGRFKPIKKKAVNEIRGRVFPEIEVVDIRGRDRFPLDITQERVVKISPMDTIW